MMHGFKKDTEFIVFEPDSSGQLVEQIRTFNDYSDGDNVRVLNRKGEIIWGTIKRHPIGQVLYRLTLSSKRFKNISTNKIYDKYGNEFSEDGIKIGTLINTSTRDKREYYNVGYAIPEKQDDPVHIDDYYKEKRHGTISYTFYDTSDNIIEIGLTRREVEDLVYNLSHVNYEDIVNGLITGEYIETGEDYSIYATPVHKWWLYDGNKEMFLREGQRLYDNNLYNPENSLISGSSWYLKDINIHEFVKERPWTITSKRYHSFMLKNHIPTGE